VDALGPAASSTGGYSVFDFFGLEWNSGGGGGSSPGVPFNATQPLHIPLGTAQPSPPQGALPLRYLVAAPILRSGWVLVGEAGKFVTMAGARSRDFVETDSGFSVVVEAADPDSPKLLDGAGGEVIVMLVVPPLAQAPIPYTCSTTAAQPVMTLVCSGVTCVCS